MADEGPGGAAATRSEERVLLERVARGAPLAEVLAAVCAAAESLLPGARVCIDLHGLPGHDASAGLAPAARAAGLHAALSLPLPVEPLGTATISAHYAAPREGGEREGNVLTRLGRIAAIAVERRRRESRRLTEHQLGSVGSFAAGIAHDINNPLAFLTGNISFLRARLGELAALPGAEGTARDMDEALADLAEGARRIESIVRDLRGFTPGDDKPATVELRRALEFAVRMAFNEVRHRARLQRDFERAPVALGDEGHVVQVVVSLLIYAAQSMPERGPEGEPREARELDDNQVTLSARAEGGEAIIEVRDNGPGIPPERLAGLFDAFVDPGSTVGAAAPPPNPLGLAISHSLVTAMGGRLTVESPPADGGAARGGTCFRVALPLPSSGEATRPRLLVVDDETLVGASIRRMLGPRAEVVLAEDARTALELCAREPFDAVLCDVAMASLDRRRPLHAELARVRPHLASRTGFIGGAPEARTLHEGAGPAGSIAARVLDKPLRVDAVQAVLALLLA